MKNSISKPPIKSKTITKREKVYKAIGKGKALYILTGIGTMVFTFYKNNRQQIDSYVVSTLKDIGNDAMKKNKTK